MNRQEIYAQVAPLFSRTGRGTDVGVEQEMFAMDPLGAGVSPDRVHNAIGDGPYRRWLSFEPGGQVELSLPPAPTPAAATSALVEATRALADDLSNHSIYLAARPTRDRDHFTPRYLHTRRYNAMERHFDTIGPAGRRMMRATASTQACLDWWSGSEGIEQWRVLLLAGPFLAAATTLSDGPQSRLATWLEVDSSRTAFDDRLLRGDDPVAAYADFAAGATAFLPGDADHVTTLFPPVRPRGRYLEIRFPDARPAALVEPLLEGLTGLLYDSDRRRSALATLTCEGPRLAEHWAAAAAGSLDRDLGLALLRTRDLAVTA